MPDKKVPKLCEVRSRVSQAQTSYYVFNRIAPDIGGLARFSL